uniref:Uncharacterized protein n=1 Tax=Parascaris univalens TaxID=6257 RepID=A0A914ZQV1_PARUN
FLVMGGCPSILFHFQLALAKSVFASSSQVESLSWYPDHERLSNTNAIIIIIALIGGLVVVIAFIILHLTRPRVGPEKIEHYIAAYPSMPPTRPLLIQNKQRDDHHQETHLLTSKTDTSDGIIMEDTQWTNDEIPATRDEQQPGKESEDRASASSTRTEGDGREREQLESDRTESSRTKAESNETSGPKQLSVSDGRDASSRSSSSRRTQTSSWGWMRSPRDAFANRPPQINMPAFQFPPWMNLENAPSGIITDNSSGLPLGFAAPPVFSAQTLPLETPQRIPQVLPFIGQPQVPPLLNNPILPVLTPVHYQQSSPFIGVPFILSPETTQPTQQSAASDSDKKEPSSERASNSN